MHPRHIAACPNPATVRMPVGSQAGVSSHVRPGPAQAPRVSRSFHLGFPFHCPVRMSVPRWAILRHGPKDHVLAEKIRHRTKSQDTPAGNSVHCVTDRRINACEFTYQLIDSLADPMRWVSGDTAQGVPWRTASRSGTNAAVDGSTGGTWKLATHDRKQPMNFGERL